MSSTQMDLFKDGVPAYLRSMELDETTKALMGGSSSGKRISIRGSVFRMIVDGKEIAKNDDRSMNVVVVASAPTVARTYYENTYVEGENQAPTCFSHDGRLPDESVEKPMSKSCMTCPMNIKGSGKTGGRACGFSQRIAVVAESDIEGDVYQISLPSMSLFGDNKDGKMTMQGYARLLGSHGLPITAVVTEMRFDTDSSVPKLTFKAVRPLTEQEIVLAREQGQSEDARRAISTSPDVLDGGVKVAPVEEIKKVEQKEAAAPAEKPPTKRAKKEPPAPAPVLETPAVTLDDDELAKDIEEWGEEGWDD